MFVVVESVILSIISQVHFLSPPKDLTGSSLQDNNITFDEEKIVPVFAAFIKIL